MSANALRQSGLVRADTGSVISRPLHAQPKKLFAAGSLPLLLAQPEAANADHLRAPDGSPLGEDKHVEIQRALDALYGTGALGKAPIPQAALEDGDEVKVEAFVGAIDQAFDGLFASLPKSSEPSSRERGAAFSVDGAMEGAKAAFSRAFSAFGELSSEDLLVEFLKLSVEDPANDPRTHHELYKLASEGVKHALEVAKARMKEAEKKLQEARRKQRRAGFFKKLFRIVSLVVGVLTFGATLFGTGGMSFALKAVLFSAVLVTGTLAHLAELEATLAMLAAETLENQARRQEHFADAQRDRVDEESRVIRTIMERKNDMVQGVLNMMREAAATTEKIIALSYA